MSLKGLAQKVVFRSRQGDSQKYTRGSPSPSKSFRQKPRSFGDYNEDDPVVCLNCTREKCNGTEECYKRRKEEKRKQKMNEIDLINKVVEILTEMMDEIYILKTMIWEKYNENRN